MLLVVLEIFMPWSLGSPWENFPLVRNTHLSLSSCRIENWAFSLWELLLATIYLQHFYSIATIQPKIPKTLASFIVLFIILANQYIQLLVGSTTFYNWKLLKLISCTWESSRYFSGTVAGERSAIGKKFGKETWKLNIICCFISLISWHLWIVPRCTLLCMKVLMPVLLLDPWKLPSHQNSW